MTEREISANKSVERYASPAAGLAPLTADVGCIEIMKKHIPWLLAILAISLPISVLIAVACGARRPMTELFQSSIEGARVVLLTNSLFDKAVIWLPMLLSIMLLILMVTKGRIIASYSMALILSSLMTALLLFGLLAIIGP